MVLGLFILSFVIMIVGVIPWSDLGINRIATRYWWFAELSALFLVMGLIIGVVWRMKESELVGNFVDGARDMVGVALVVALARGISVLMTNGLIIDTVLHWCEQALAPLGPVAFINVIYLLYLPLSFLIPSSSGLATVTMPIMAPLAGFAGVPENLVVTAYQSASGLLNLVHADLRGRDGRAADRARADRDVVEVRAAAGHPAGHPDHDRALDRSADSGLKSRNISQSYSGGNTTCQSI